MHDMSCFHRFSRPCSIYCAIPPYMLEGIISNGNEKQKELARATLHGDRFFRHGRSATAEFLHSTRSARRLWQLVLSRSPWLSAAAGDKNRIISDAENTRIPQGRRIVRKEGEPPTGDSAVDEAYDALGATFDLFFDVYKRNSIDDKGLPLQATVHFGQSYDNAFWDGKRMVFGDGDEDLPPEERIWNRFTVSVDVIGHELTHGVTENEAGLIYWGQAGALNESISDVFGSMVKQYLKKEDVEQADWLIGEGLLTSNVNAQAIRSMKAPGTAYDDPLLGGKDPQPAHMRDYVRTFQDNGGVHINSGIPNHAFYLAAKNMGGFSWEKTGLIWYKTLLSPFLRRFMQFRGFARMTYWTATGLFGHNSAEQKAIQEAWAAVGIQVARQFLAA